MTRTIEGSRSDTVVLRRVRRRQDDHGTARPADPPLRHSRNRQRELALQKPNLRPMPRGSPPGPTAPPHARRSVACEGTARRARVPSVDSGDDRCSTASVGRDWTLIPGPGSALIDNRREASSVGVDVMEFEGIAFGLMASPSPDQAMPTAKTTTPLAGMTIEADAAKSCMGPPFAQMPPPFPATWGFGKLS